MKNIFGLLMAITLLGISYSAQAKQCSAECHLYNLDESALIQDLPGNPILSSSDWKSLNDSCRALVAGYANTHIIMQNFSVIEVAPMNMTISSPLGGFTHSDVVKLRSEGFKIGAVLMGKIAEMTSSPGGVVIGYPNEDLACQ